MTFEVIQIQSIQMKAFGDEEEEVFIRATKVGGASVSILNHYVVPLVDRGKPAVSNHLGNLDSYGPVNVFHTKMEWLLFYSQKIFFIFFMVTA